MSITMIYGDHAGAVDGREDDDRLWLDASSLAAATGWELKPQGLCRDEACIAVPAGATWRDEDGRVDVTALAEHLGQPVVHDARRAVWAFGESAHARGDALLSGVAPDFSLPDIDGTPHRLSEYRGRKVFLFTYGSYCGCGFDLPCWQVVYDELKDRGIVFISVALDAAGVAAVGDRILASDLAERDPFLGKGMGWNDDIWSRQAVPEYPCLIDTEHVVADLFNMTNVPMAVWIDEEGRVVRPAEAAGFGDSFRGIDWASRAMPDGDDEHAEILRSNRDVYIAALRDWVANGQDSFAAMSAEEVRAAQRLPSEADVRAATHARIGKLLFDRGDNAGAEEHFRAATELAPDKWNYRRQSMVLDPQLVGQINSAPEFVQALEDLGEGHYYPPIALPGIRVHNGDVDARP